MDQKQYVPNYLVLAILATIFCCLPFGIVGIVYAANVNTKLETDDISGANNSSSKMWTWISFGQSCLLLEKVDAV